MSRRHAPIPFRLVPGLLLAAAGALAQPAPDGATPDAPPGPAESPLARVAFVGASVSAGFFSVLDGDDRVVTPERAFRAALAQPASCVTSTHASAMFFTSPGAHGPMFMSRALDGDPTAVVALDFLFWFGYGSHDTQGRPLRTADDRLRLLEKGLEQLDRFDGPLVVGDFPDMSDAVGVMLSPAQVPDAEARRRLNDRLAAWAADHPNVIVFPLADLVAQIKSGRGVRAGGREWPDEQARGFLSADHLHPSPQGQAVTAILVAQALDERLESVQAGDFVLDLNAIVERLKAPDPR